MKGETGLKWQQGAQLIVPPVFYFERLKAAWMPRDEFRGGYR